MRAFLFLLIATLAGACGARRQPPPAPTTTPAPVLVGQTVMVFPVQRGNVPVRDTTAHRFPIEGPALDAELAYWLPQVANNVRWVLPSTIQRAIARSPALGVDITNLDVTSFQRAQVKRIGDPLFGDLRKLASVLDARIAVIPVAAEAIGSTAGNARVHTATAVIDAMSGNVLWFGVHEATEAGNTQAGIANVAQVFARAFAGKRN